MSYLTFLCNYSYNVQELWLALHQYKFPFLKPYKDKRKLKVSNLVWLGFICKQSLL